MPQLPYGSIAQGDPLLPGLIEALILGLGETPLWSSFIARFRDAVGADYASIVFRPFAPNTPHQRVVHLFSGADSPPSISRDYRERLYLQDPLPYDRLEPGRPYDIDDLLDGDDPRHRAYRRDLLAPSNMNYLRIKRCEEPRGASAWLIASKRERCFDAEDERLFKQLAPYLRAALTARVANERERIERYVAGEAMRRMNFGWLTLDAVGVVIDADPSAEAILADPAGHLMRDRGGKLRAREDDVGHAISELLGSSGKPPRRPRAVILCREPWLDMLLLPVQIQSDEARPTPSVVAYIHADRWTSEDHYEHLHSLFDLTPREASLALALSRGKSIREAAEEMRLTIGAARTYTKRIYSKTGARGQSDLIRYIHRSVMVLT